jgi:hypothetical protein
LRKSNFFDNRLPPAPSSILLLTEESMITISDLDYCEDVKNMAPVQGSTGTGVGAIALALGDTSYTLTKTRSRARPLPHDGGISISIGRAFGFASDPIDAFVWVDVDGFTDGVITIERTRSRIIDRGRTAFGRARGIFIAITPPDPR